MIYAFTHIIATCSVLTILRRKSFHRFGILPFHQFHHFNLIAQKHHHLKRWKTKRKAFIVKKSKRRTKTLLLKAWPVATQL